MVIIELTHRVINQLKCIYLLLLYPRDGCLPPNNIENKCWIFFFLKFNKCVRWDTAFDEPRYHNNPCHMPPGYGFHCAHALLETQYCLLKCHQATSQYWINIDRDPWTWLLTDTLLLLLWMYWNIIGFRCISCWNIPVMTLLNLLSTCWCSALASVSASSNTQMIFHYIFIIIIHILQTVWIVVELSEILLV